MNLILLQPVLKAFDDRHNLGEIEGLVGGLSGSFAPADIILLPEHFTSESDPDKYSAFVRKLAQTAGCTVVGGSHHRRKDGKSVNAGSVFDASGRELSSYTKLRPYFNELNNVEPGDGFGELEVGGLRVMTLICADFWYSDILLGATVQPDLILVPSLSVSRKASPEFSRSLWHHLAITRAYEFGAYVGISDWSDASVLPKYRTCGVGGFADPTTAEPEAFFRPIPENGVAVYAIDRPALDSFRGDRRARGFFWEPGSAGRQYNPPGSPPAR